jgi:hypothetical protein
MRRLGVLLVVTAAAALVAAPGASAAATRAEYVAQVNPICKQANTQSGKVFSRAIKGQNPDQIKPGVLTKALKRVNRITRKTTNRIAGVPAAPGDEALVAEWVASRRHSQRLSDQLLAVDQDLTTAERQHNRKLIGRVFKRVIRIIDRLIPALKRETGLATQLGLTQCGGNAP